jgi:hypothetical protein
MPMNKKNQFIEDGNDIGDRDYPAQNDRERRDFHGLQQLGNYA